MIIYLHDTIVHAPVMLHPVAKQYILQIK